MDTIVQNTISNENNTLDNNMEEPTIDPTIDDSVLLYRLMNKIGKKIDILKILTYYQFPILNCQKETQKHVLKFLERYPNNTTAKFYISNLNNLLSDIITNAYQSSDFHLLMTNIPSVTNHNGEDEYITPEHICDTIEQFTGNDTVSLVFQISISKYLVRFHNPEHTDYFYDIANKKLLAGNKMNLLKIRQLELVNCLKPIELLEFMALLNQVRTFDNTNSHALESEEDKNNQYGENSDENNELSVLEPLADFVVRYEYNDNEPITDIYVEYNNLDNNREKENQSGGNIISRYINKIISYFW